MKLLFYLTLFALLGISETVFSQNDDLNLDIKNKTVKEVFKYIENHSNYRFLYNDDFIGLNRIVNYSGFGNSIEEVLDKLLTEVNLTYRELENYLIVITPSELLHQENVVSGRVIELQTGYSLPGVTVMLTGTALGTVTNIDGKFSLAVPADAGSLRFSFVGMQTQEVAIEGRTVIDAVMVGVPIGLDEIVVVGYGEQRRATLTGSATRVTYEELIDMPNISLAQRLEGRAAGVRIAQSSSITGSSATIRIRGANAEPLYVIDDVVVDKRDFDALTPEEVESINIMKDAATSSIYGARAADGVIVVRTKRGTYNQPARLTYHGTGNVQFFPHGYKEWDYTWDDYMLEFDFYEYFGDQGRTQAEKDWLAANPDFRGFGMAREYIWRTPTGQEHRLSKEGGSENISYFASIGLQNATAGVRNADYNKYNFRTALSSRIHENIRLEWISSGFVEESQRPYWQYGDGSGQEEGVQGWFQHLGYDPAYVYGVVVDKEAGTGRIARPEDRGTENFQWAGDGAWRFWPLDDRGTGYRDNTWRRFNNILSLNWDLSSITEGLSTSVSGNYSYNTHMYKHHNTYISRYTPTRPSADNRWVYHTDLSRWGYEEKFAASMGIPDLQQNQNVTNRYQVNAFLNYDRSFGSHNVTAVGLFEYAGNYNWASSGGRQNPRIDRVDQFFNYSGDRADTWFSGSEGHYARASFAGRLNYNYQEKYIVEFSFRNDASYLFPRDTRWGFFPSFSAAWRIDQEDFFNVPWINSLKPRVSYGTSGSEGGIGPYQFQDTYHLTAGWLYASGPAPGLRTGVMPNPDITWAKTEAVNIGLDFGVFNNTVFGGIDLFKRKNADILGARIMQFPSTWGASLPPVNYGETEGQGAELFLNHRNQVGQFTYSIAGNISYSIDKVVLIDESPEVAGSWRSAVGRPVHQVWGYRTHGIIKDQATLDALDPDFRQFGRVPEIGDLLLQDIRGVGFEDGADGRIDGYDYDRLSENGSPRIIYGFNLGSAWRGFSLDMHFSGVGRYDKMYGQAWGAGTIWRNAHALPERWHPEFNPDGWIPALRQELWGRPERGHGPTDIFMMNAAYLRLKNITLGYQLPQQWMQGFGIDRVRIYVSGTDLFTFTPYKFGDPEIANQTSYPRNRTLSGGLTVNF